MIVRINGTNQTEGHSSTVNINHLRNGLLVVTINALQDGQARLLGASTDQQAFVSMVEQNLPYSFANYDFTVNAAYIVSAEGRECYDLTFGYTGIAAVVIRVDRDDLLLKLRG